MYPLKCSFRLHYCFYIQKLILQGGQASQYVNMYSKYVNTKNHLHTFLKDKVLYIPLKILDDITEDTTLTCNCFKDFKKLMYTLHNVRHKIIGCAELE